MLTIAGTAGCEAEELGSLLGIGDEPPPPPPPAKPKARRYVPPPPPPKPALPASAMHLRANLAFDMVRARGIAEVYEGRTKVALATFKSARAMKPNDQSVQLWIDAINDAMRSKQAKAPPRMRVGGLPGSDVGDSTPPVLNFPTLVPTPGPIPSFDPRLVF
ncbi:MAG: hypothetical protein VKN33_03325 [Candidatus Sericytochromatia bacterium]|nr:hypothetical protein [Candidatus Sericytochromatia bacterium]